MFMVTESLRIPYLEGISTKKFKKPSMPSDSSSPFPTRLCGLGSLMTGWRTLPLDNVALKSGQNIFFSHDNDSSPQNS